MDNIQDTYHNIRIQYRQTDAILQNTYTIQTTYGRHTNTTQKAYTQHTHNIQTTYRHNMDELRPTYKDNCMKYEHDTDIHDTDTIRT